MREREGRVVQGRPGGSRSGGEKGREKERGSRRGRQRLDGARVKVYAPGRYLCIRRGVTTSH